MSGSDYRFGAAETTMGNKIYVLLSSCMLVAAFKTLELASEAKQAYCDLPVAARADNVHIWEVEVSNDAPWPETAKFVS